eukprot:TRINITY_DN7859_c0_g2_i1.p1 TRINITY_DN7859_c0_g2~~TRINITY_DN7859_c0_g2_i1.p1  ORF type:complete len:269 (+),score=38.18 TRINITY_DN7859_c0_g2_i1:144-950(+)
MAITNLQKHLLFTTSQPTCNPRTSLSNVCNAGLTALSFPLHVPPSKVKFTEHSNPLKISKFSRLQAISELKETAQLFSLASENTGYSEASYYTSLGLFVLSLPGLWSLIKRSTKSKIVQKTFVVDNVKSPSQVAGEIMSFFTRNNFTVADAGETITFEGIMVPSRGQAAFLTFCTCLSLASVALVLTITVPDVGEKWYWITALSPLAGFYYWTRASRKEQIKVKMIIDDDNSSTDVIVQGDDEQVDQLRRELKLMEKGMVYVKGILER